MQLLTPQSTVAEPLNRHESYEHWRDALCRNILAAPHDKVWHAILDPNADEALPELLWEFYDSSHIFPLFMNTMNHESMLRGPLFVTIQKPNRFVEWFFEKSGQKPLGILYHAPAEKTDLLFEHLQNLVECSLPGERKGVFRFYDPRILYALCQCGDEKLKATITGPAIALHAWEPGFERAVELAGENYFLEQEGFFLEQTLLDCFSKQTTTYAVIQNMQGERGDLLRSKPQNEVLLFVSEICNSLFELGITDIYGCIVGTSFVMQVGHNIFKDEIIQKTICENINKYSLLDILLELPDASFPNELLTKE